MVYRRSSVEYDGDYSGSFGRRDQIGYDSQPTPSSAVYSVSSPPPSLEHTPDQGSCPTYQFGSRQPVASTSSLPDSPDNSLMLVRTQSSKRSRDLADDDDRLSKRRQSSPVDRLNSRSRTVTPAVTHRAPDEISSIARPRMDLVAQAGPIIHGLKCLDRTAARDDVLAAAREMRAAGCPVCALAGLQSSSHTFMRCPLVEGHTELFASVRGHIRTYRTSGFKAPHNGSCLLCFLPDSGRSQDIHHKSKGASQGAQCELADVVLEAGFGLLVLPQLAGQRQELQVDAPPTIDDPIRLTNYMFEQVVSACCLPKSILTSLGGNLHLAHSGHSAALESRQGSSARLELSIAISSTRALSDPGLISSHEGIHLVSATSNLSQKLRDYRFVQGRHDWRTGGSDNWIALPCNLPTT
jgi:hypothetical protein